MTSFQMFCLHLKVKEIVNKFYPSEKEVLKGNNTD